MKRISKSLKVTVLVLLALLLLAQVIRMDRSNPPVRADLPDSATAKPILKRACYNCHSNETVWPWYSGVAPVSWLVESDVKDGREHMNFSEWGAYDGGTQSHKLRAIAEEMQSEEMPPWYYTLAHKDSRLTKAERNQILAWTKESVKAEAK